MPVSHPLRGSPPYGVAPRCFMSSLTLSILAAFRVSVNNLFTVIYDLLLLHMLSTVYLCILHILVHVAQYSWRLVVHIAHSPGFGGNFYFFV